ncbi:MAG: hypothetical protein DCC75_13940 [Proteobacteria bacterium]|nr:MAG: hypothetical protein DCC75_13940 [Pseudomonadota bacterium]
MREEDTVITQPGDRSEQALLEPHTGLSARALETIDRKVDLGADFKMLREHAMLKLLTNPFITPAHEMWRYTKPELFKFKEAINAAAVDFQLRDYLTGDKIQAADGLEMAKGIGITPLLLEELLKERAQDLEEDVVTSLQLACTSSVCTLKVTGSYNSDKPVQILQKVGEGLSACPLPSLRIGRAAGQHLDPPVVRTNRG